MTQKSKNRNESASKQRVLQGYRQEGKRFIPPFLQIMNLAETDWMNDRVPELIWIALFIQKFGTIDGPEMAVRIAKAASGCVPSAEKAYAATSEYMALSDEQKQCVRSALSAEGTLENARLGMEALSRHYKEFPLGFLGEPSKSIGAQSGSTLDDLKATIRNIRDRHSNASTVAQAVVVQIYFANNKLVVIPNSGLANLSAVCAYPLTDESKRVAASIRASVNLMLTRDIASDWRNSFWKQGRSLGPCEAE